MTNLVKQLHEWTDIQAEFSNAALLIGNGGSRAIWEDFKYQSLFTKAKKLKTSRRLDAADQKVFAELGASEDFELVLSQLATASRVCEIFEQSDAVIGEIHERYQKIREALLHAISDVHLRWSDDLRARLRAINNCYRSAKAVFTLNYDFLWYWALMEDSRRLTDFFNGSQKFDRDYGEQCVLNGRIPVLYLHGALQLYQDLDGEPRKLKRRDDQDLLTILLLNRAQHKWRVPLFVSEGSAEQKEKAIGRSNYLLFAWEQFRDWDGPVVVFGCSLDDRDKHLRKILQSKQRDIAISIRESDPQEINKRMVLYLDGLKSVTDNVCFYRASSHVLGDASMKMPSPAPLGR